ncbi:P-loop containing nucleoside triphosphate hydrolase protein [Hyaloraphidium curvatum]|nr:P-loop containing nucleoside triphosphate hydrolase protein [Hyaloraphidium curvatum]
MPDGDGGPGDTPLDYYTKGVRVWLTDDDEGWVSGVLRTRALDAAGKVRLVFAVDGRDKERVFESSIKDLERTKYADLPPLRNPPMLEGIDDLTLLSHLHEPAVLHNIKLRYSQKQIYTYSGIVLVAMNPYQRLPIYSPEVMRAYSGRKRGELEPHLFAIAEEAYSSMIRDDKNQSIIVSGESGAGKTQSAKYIMRYFATVDDLDKNAGDSEFGGSTGPSSANHTGMSEIEEAVLATNPITEAFGNAKTTRNDNSSRFGKYIEIQFSKPNGKTPVRIVGAKIRTYLLERSRLVFQPMNERNYHVFYQLCAGCPTAERREFGLNSWETFHYLNQGQDGVIAGVDDAAEFQITQHALSQINIQIATQWQIFRICAALLHIGNIQITQARSGEAQIGDGDAGLQWATKLLEIDGAEFRKWLVRKQLAARTETVVTNLNAQQAITGRDSVAKYIYVALFEWIINMVNKDLDRDDAAAAKAQGRSFIGVLDIYGFEHFKKNSFEQFCINYANEKLQQEFNQHVFKLEQEEYMAEQINWSFIDFNDNQPCIDLIEGKLGILDLLDEESRLPSGSDTGLVGKLYARFAGTTPQTQQPFFEKPRFSVKAFTVKHYAIGVSYDIDGFLEKNKDTVTEELLAVLSNSKSAFLRDVLAAMPGSGPSEDASGKVKSTKIKSTLGSIFKASLIELMKTIRSTEVHYIRCIKPNPSKEAFGFDPIMVLAQLRACGVLETIRISCAGYPSRWTFGEFADRYYMLIPSKDWTFDKPRDFTQRLAEATIKDPDKYQLGLTKIFFRTGMLAYFEKLRTDRLRACVILIQKNMRRQIARKKYQELRKAAITLQAATRALLARKLYRYLRDTRSAIRVQRTWRGYVQKKRYERVRKAIVKIQAVVRGYFAWRRVFGLRQEKAATDIQRVFRGYQVRKERIKKIRKIVLIQSLWRRILARRELTKLRIEAKSLNKLMEVKYQLENKVFELSQKLVDRDSERGQLIDRASHFEALAATWKDKFERADSKIKELLEPAVQAKKDLADRDKLLSEKEKEMVTVDEARKQLLRQNSELSTSMKAQEVRLLEMEAIIKRQAEAYKTLQQDLEIQKEEITRAREEAAKAREDFIKQKELSEKLRKEIAKQPPPISPDEIEELEEELARSRKEVAKLRQQLSATGRTQELEQLRAENKRLTALIARQKLGQYANGPSQQGDESAYDVPPDARNMRNGSNVRILPQSPQAVVSAAARNAADDVDVDDYDSEDADDYSRGMSDDEATRILEDDHLIEEIVDKLVRNLAIPAPNGELDLQRREVFFSSHLIGVVAETMLKHGLVARMQALMTNVMRAILSVTVKSNSDDYISCFWLSNTYELWSIMVHLRDVDEKRRHKRQAHGRRMSEGSESESALIKIVNDLNYLIVDIFRGWMESMKKRLNPMVVSAVILHEELPNFKSSKSSKQKAGWFSSFNSPKSSPGTEECTIEDLLQFISKIDKGLRSYYVEPTMSRQIVVELIRLIGYSSTNELLMRKNFATWKRGMQIQYNGTKLQEWIVEHEVPEATVHLEPLMQATKLLQLNKSSAQDLDTIFEVCFLLNAYQIRRLLSLYHATDFDTPVSTELLKAVAKRTGNDSEEAVLLNTSAFEFSKPMPRAVEVLEAWFPAWLHVPRVVQVLESQ